MATIAEAIEAVARFEMQDEPDEYLASHVRYLSRRLERGDVRTVHAVHLARFVLETQGKVETATGGVRQ